MWTNTDTLAVLAQVAGFATSTNPAATWLMFTFKIVLVIFVGFLVLAVFFRLLRSPNS